MIEIPKEFILYINIGIVVFYLIFIVIGKKRGFLKQIISLVGVVLSLFFAWRYCALISSYVHIVPKAWLPLQDTLIADAISGYANIIGWCILLFLVFRLVFKILESIVGKFQKVPIIKQFSGILGGALGAISATIWIFVICMILNSSFIKNGEYIIRNSGLQVVRDTVSLALQSQDIPLSGSELVNQLYLTSQNMNDDDKNAIEDWLISQGFETTSKEDSKSEEK